MRFFYCLRGWDGGCHYHYHVLWLRSLRGGVGDNDDNNNRRVCWGGSVWRVAMCLRRSAGAIGRLWAAGCLSVRLFRMVSFPVRVGLWRVRVCRGVRGLCVLRALRRGGVSRGLCLLMRIRRIRGWCVRGGRGERCRVRRLPRSCAVLSV